MLWAGIGGVLLLPAAVLLALTVFAQVDGPDHGIFCQAAGRDLEVIGVVAGSRWAAAGFHEGDRIQTVDGQAESLLDRLYAIKMGQQPGVRHSFEVQRGGRVTEFAYEGGPTTAPVLNPVNLAIFTEVLVKLVFLAAAAYFTFLFRSEGVLSRLSGALFLQLALLTPFFQLNLAYLVSEFGLAAGGVLLGAELLVCFLPAVVATLGTLLPPTETPLVRPRFVLRSLLAVLGVLYASYLYVGLDFLGRLDRAPEPAALLRFFPVFRILNDAFMLLLVGGTVGGLMIMMTHLQRRQATQRLSAFQRLLGLFTLGLALPLLAGLAMAAAGWQYTPAYGLRKLAYVLFPLLYIQAVHYFTRRPDDAPHDAVPHPSR
jgi:hypothetical protein